MQLAEYVRVFLTGKEIQSMFLIFQIPALTRTMLISLVWGTLLEADHSFEYSQADFLAYFWIHCRNVSSSPGARNDGLDRTIWSIAASTHWRNHIWGRHDRDIGVGPGNKSHEIRDIICGGPSCSSKRSFCPALLTIAVIPKNSHASRLKSYEGINSGSSIFSRHCVQRL